jgi:hypothetical protein
VKREKIVRILTEQRVEIGLTFVQVDQIANALTGEPVNQRFRRVRSNLFPNGVLNPGIDKEALAELIIEAEEDEHMAELISERYDDKHLG